MAPTEAVPPPPKRHRAARENLNSKRSRLPSNGVEEGASKRFQVGVGAGGEAAPPVRRPRRGVPEALRDCILGYIDDESGDPPRSGTTKYRQSKEITEMLKVEPDLPIAKERRSDFVWVAAVRLPDGRKKFTWDAEVMTPCPKFQLEEDNTCDICGACCIEVLYEFRCYRRLAKKSPQERRLEPTVSYISKECGRGLLGVQSEASKLRERLYTAISADPDQAVETLKQLWSVANAAQQKVITDELRHFAGIEIGEADKTVELRTTEAEHGPLHKNAEDVFRATSRSMGGTLNPRELACLAVRTAQDTGTPVSGFFATVASALQSGQPLPAPPVPWAKDDVRESLGHLVKAWPIRVELLDSLSKAESFTPEGQEELFAVRLIYLHGCGELHAFAKPEVEKAQGQALRSTGGERLRDTYVAYKLTAEGGHSSGLHKGHRKKEDEELVLPEGSISPDCMENALQSISWPDCITRGNVVPEGTTVISAFPLGIVNNYALGLMASKPTVIRPKLTRMLTRYLAQHDPSFTYTTIQLNKDYAARMHVDGNNEGPSYIIALGDYTGGGLWIYDEANGDVDMELKEPMRGFPHLKVGSKLKGSIVDIKNRWFAFNGTIPHMALPFQGTRLSIVYFSRKGWQRIGEDVVQQLQDLEFKVPRGTILPGGGGAAAAAAAPTQQEHQQQEPPDEVDEVSSDASSSDEEGGQEPGQASHAWAARFRLCLGYGAPGPEAAALPPGQGRVVLQSCHAGMGVPALALRELLPEPRSRTLCVSELEDGAMRFVRANCRPEFAFENISDVMAGEGHCEIHHRIARMPRPADADLLLFTAGFHVSVLSGLETRAARLALVHGACSDPYHALHRYMVANKPHLAILELRGLSEIPVAQRPGLLRCFLDGIDGGNGERSWGVKQMGNYGVELLELRAVDFGLPLADSHSFAILVREDVGGQRAAELAANIARALRGLLPKTHVGELLLENSSARLMQIVKEWKRMDRLVEPSDASKKSQKSFQMEGKDLGIKPGEAPYLDLLYKELGFQEKEWFPHATPNQKTFLNLAYAQAKRNGAELSSTVVDMFKNIRTQPYRDDGLLPPSSRNTSAVGAPHYSFCKHRPLTGLEVLGCRGMPARDFDLKAVGDIATARLASLAVPLPVFGAVLCGSLTAVDLDTCPTFSITSGKAAELLSSATASPDELSVASLRAQLPDETTEDVQFGGRAAVLLNLVRSASFGQQPQVSGGKAAAPSGEAAKLIHSALAKVAAEQGDPGDLVQIPTEAEAGAGRVSPDEAKEWPARLTNLRAGKLGFAASAPSLGAAVRWMREAAEDRNADLASDIIEVGTVYLCKSLEKAQQIPPAVAEQRTELLGALRDASKESEATRISQVLTQARFLQELSSGSARLAVQKQKDGDMGKYVEGILRKISAWPMRRGYLDHFAQAVRSGWAPNTFAQQGGLALLFSWLQESPEHLDRDWPAAAETLLVIATATAANSADTAVGLLPFLHATAARLGAPGVQLASKLEPLLVQLVVTKLRDMTPKQGVPKILQDCAGRSGEPWRRFEVSLDLVHRVRKAMEDARDKSSRSVAQWRREKADFSSSASSILARAEGAKDGHWRPLAQLEEKMVQSVEASFDALLGKAGEEETAEETRKQQEKQRWFEKEVANLAEMLKDGELRDATSSGLETLIATMKEVRTRMSEGLKSSMAAATIRTAEAAGRRFCERPERRSRQDRWLRQQGLGYCRELLETQGLIDSLDELGVQCRFPGAVLPERWETAGLPKRACQTLLAAATSGKLRKGMFDILDNEVPVGWTREFSQGAGLHYFKRMYGRGTEWVWPTEEELPESIQEPPAPHTAAVLPLPSTARYLAKDDTGRVVNLLSGARGDEHPAEAASAGMVEEWEKLAAALQGVRVDFMARLGLVSSGKAATAKSTTPMPQVTAGSGVKVSKEACPGLTRVWTAELVTALTAVGAPQRVLEVFWHRLVKPHIPAESGGSVHSLLAGLRDMVREAHFQELSDDVERERERDRENVASGSSMRQKAVEISQRVKSKLNGQGCLNLAGVTGTGARAAACADLVALTRELQAFLKSCDAGKQKDQLQAKATAALALQAARRAVRHHCEGPARCGKAEEWLQRHGQGHCAQLLREVNLLDRLVELSQNPTLATSLGVPLPRGCLALLTAAAADGRLIEEDVRPAAPGDGWTLTLSSSTGLHYVVHRDGRQQWEWPDVPTPAEASALTEPPALPLIECPSASSPSTGAGDASASTSSSAPASYLVQEPGETMPFDLLCGVKADANHINSPAHTTAVSHWNDLAASWTGLAADLKEARDAAAQHVHLQAGIQKAFNGEILSTLTGIRAPARVTATFWHRVAKPQLACLRVS